MEESRRITKVVQRDEIYPNNYLSGCPGLTYRQAVGVKAQQERYMNADPNKVEVNLEIVQIPGREDEYYVHNTSTYVKDITSLNDLNQMSLPPWAKQNSDGTIEFLSVAPFYLGEMQVIKSACTNAEENLEKDEEPERVRRIKPSKKELICSF